MRYRSKASVRYTGVLLALTAIGALPLLAQQPAAQPNDEAIQLPAVEVTATLRSEPLLAIPISVAVRSGTDLLDANMAGLADVTMQMPSFTFRTQGSMKDEALLIRGVGTISTSPGTEPDVSTVVDGVVLARPGEAIMNLMDIDHIEVLKGPQGTLFGKNSSVGVVNVVTKDPTSTPQGYVDVRYFGGGGSGSEEDLRLGGSGPIVAGKLFAAAGMLIQNYGGNVDNVYLHQTVNGSHSWGGRLKVVYTPNEKLKGTFTANFMNSFVDTAGVLIATSTTGFPSGVTAFSAGMAQAILPVIASTSNTQTESAWHPRDYDINAVFSAKFDYTVGDYTFTSITAYEHWYNFQLQDQNNVSNPLYIAGYSNTYTSYDHGWLWFDGYSQELRITSPSGRFLEYVAGLYVQRALDTETYRRDVTQMPAAGVQVQNFGEAHYGTHGNNMAVYGEGTWNFTKRFRAVTGLRITKDTLEFYHQRVSSSPVAVPGVQPSLAVHSGDTQADGVSGRAGLQYDVGKDTMVYVTYVKGYKGPAYNVFFNQTLLQVLPMQPETSDDYEIGIKSLAFNNRLQFTATVFDTIYKNYQANFQTYVLGTAVTNLINAGQVSTKGVEFDCRAILTPDFTISGSVSRINSRIDNFFTPAGATNVNGQPLPFAPTFKSNVQALYSKPFGNGMKFSAETDYTYTTKQQFALTETPDTVQPAYGIWNISFAIAKPVNGWKLTFFCKNVADKHYYTIIAQGTNADIGNLPRDYFRYFGMALHKDF